MKESILKRMIVSILGRFDLKITKYHRSHAAKRSRYIKDGAVTCICDVGANIGQFASEMFRGGYTGKIISFEPTTKAYIVLQERAIENPKWECHNIAIGASSEEAVVHVSANSFSSSLRQNAEINVRAFPEVAESYTEKTLVRPLGEFLGGLDVRNGAVFIKIDTQGYEDQVLAGIDLRDRKIGLVEVELSTLELYRGQKLFVDLCSLMYSAGFMLCSIDVACESPADGKLLQFDGLFIRSGTTAL